MLGWSITTQCPWCEQPNTHLTISGRHITGVKHSTIDADLKCAAIQKEVAEDLKLQKPMERRYKPTLTMDYLALMKAAEDGAYVRKKATLAAIAEAF